MAGFEDAPGRELAPDPQAMTLEELIPYWNHLVWWTSIRPVLRRMLEADLTLAEVVTLRGLGRRPLTIAEVAESLGLSHSAASRAVDRLVRDGLVHRREDPEDRRRKHLTLTPAGAALIGEMEALLAERMGRFIALLGADEQEQFRHLFARLVAAYTAAGEGDEERREDRRPALAAVRAD